MKNKINKSKIEIYDERIKTVDTVERALRVEVSV